MNFLLAGISSLLIAIFAAAFAAPYVVDWNEYRAVFEEQASKLAGRPVRVSGDVGLTILPVPEVRFADVAIADASGGFEAPSARARAFRMRLSFAPLLRGKLEAREIELDHLALRLGLDDQDRVLWPRIGDAAAGLPFLPADVSLKSVNLKEASLAVARPGAPGRWRVEGINGELSADSLRGPFKFTGRAAIGGEAREVQLSIGRAGKAGTMPVKLVSRGDQAVYRAEGNLRDVGGGPTFDGAVSASAPDVSPDAQPPWLATATAQATLDGGVLSDLKLTVTRELRPQTLTGSAEFSWSNGLHLDTDLSSRWLDIDLLAGDDLKGLTPAQAMLRLPALLSGLPLPAERARIALKVTQINLGGDMIRDLNVIARRRETGWGVEKLEAGLPGGSDVGFEGRFARKGGGPVLAGTVRVSGKDLGRLLAWAAPGQVNPQAADARAFSLSGEVESAAGGFSVSDIAARLGETQLSGAVRFMRGEPSRIVADLDARLLDLRPFIAGTSAEALRGLLARDGSGPGWISMAGTRWQIDLAAERIVLPELAAADMALGLRIAEGAIDVETLALRGPDGLKLEASGRYPLTDASARAALKLAVSAGSADAVAKIARLLPGAGPWVRQHMQRLRAAVPLTLTATLRPSAAGGGAWLEVDGKAAQTTVKADARLYEDGRYHVFASGENAQAARILRQLTPDRAGWLDLKSLSGPARISADFTGAADKPFKGRARFAAGDMELTYEGDADPGSVALDLAGALTLRAPRARRLFALAGLGRDNTNAEASAPLRLEAAIDHRGGVYEARDLSLQYDGQDATGTARLDLTGDTPQADISLAASQFNVPAVASLLIEKPLLVDTNLDARPWPETPFKLDALQALSGRLAVESDALMLASGLSLSGASLDVRLDDGELTVSELKGTLYGGELRAEAGLRAERGRAVFRGEVALEGLDLARLPHGNGEPLASGKASLELAAKSEGLTPRGLMTVMSGEGLLTLAEGEIRGLAPQVLVTTARRYLEAPEQPEKPAGALLAAPLHDSRLAHQGADIVLDIKDGDLRAKQTPLYRSGTGETLTVNARADLTEMRLRSQWTLAATLEKGEALPDVRVSFSGPLADFGRMTPEIGATEYEQFLTVKRIERNVEKLEELERQRRSDPPERPAEARAAPAAGVSGVTETLRAEPPPQPGSDLLRGFRTEIEEAPEDQPAADGQDEAPGPATPEPPPAAASSTPGASLDDPEVVEDARRELLREAPRPRRSEPDGFFEIFRN